MTVSLIGFKVDPTGAESGARRVCRAFKQIKTKAQSATEAVEDFEGTLNRIQRQFDDNGFNEDGLVQPAMIGGPLSGEVSSPPPQFTKAKFSNPDEFP